MFNRKVLREGGRLVPDGKQVFLPIRLERPFDVWAL